MQIINIKTDLVFYSRPQQTAPQSKQTHVIVWLEYQCPTCRTVRRTALKGGVCVLLHLHLHHWTGAEQTICTAQSSYVDYLVFIIMIRPTPCTPARQRLCSGCIVVVLTYHVLHPDILFTTSYLHVCLQGAGTHLCSSTDLGLLTSPSDDSFCLDSTRMPPHVQADQIFFIVIVMSAANCRTLTAEKIEKSFVVKVKLSWVDSGPQRLNSHTLFQSNS